MSWSRESRWCEKYKCEVARLIFVEILIQVIYYTNFSLQINRVILKEGYLISTISILGNLLKVKVHMNRKFFLCRYKLSPLKYTISKFETFGVKIGDVTGVQSYAFCPETWSSNRAAKRPKCHVMWRNFGCTISSISSMAVLFHIFQLSPGSLKPFEIARHRLKLRSGKNSPNVTKGKQTFATKIACNIANFCPKRLKLRNHVFQRLNFITT